MFLHLGQDVMVPLEDVVSIVNLAGVGTSDNELLSYLRCRETMMDK
ncbi:MAG: hypothetical protein QM392_06600 [Bacillota bacterium]|nr:hypothetical protein [Bacillota bacterium]